MKITAFILSFYFMLVSAQPILVIPVKSNSACEMKCCMKMKAHHECDHKNKSCPNPKQENSCPLCCCNLMQCAFCAGATIVDEVQFKINLSSKSAVVFANADSNLHSSYSSDCWQPPELV